MGTQQILPTCHPVVSHRCGPRSTRIAVEHELLAADVNTGAPVAVDRIREATRHGWYA